MFFDAWSDIVRALSLGALAYFALVALVRIAGKRTLAKLNAFDLVVTVAFGSTLATIILSSEVSLAEGVAALSLLVALQYVVAWTAVRLPVMRHLAKSEPTLLVRDGEFVASVLRRERVTEEEVRQAVRASGTGGLESVGAVVLETDGTLSVIASAAIGSGSAMRGVTVHTPA